MNRSNAGFTLIELLVVLLIISVVFVGLPIAYDRVVPGLEIRSDSREIARLLRSARGRAIAQNEETTVLIDVRNRFVRGSDQGKRFDLSKGSTLSLEAVLSEQISPDAARIRFFPDGGSTGGRVTLERLGKVYRIEVDWLFGRVRVLE